MKDGDLGISVERCSARFNVTAKRRFRELMVGLGVICHRHLEVFDLL